MRVRIQPREASADRGLDGVRQRRWPGPRRDAQLQLARLEQRADRFDRVQRVAFGFGMQLLAQLAYVFAHYLAQQLHRGFHG